MEIYDGPKYLTAAELARRWHCSVGHLANERCAGKGIDYTKLNGHVLYALADVEMHEELSRVVVAMN